MKCCPHNTSRDYLTSDAHEGDITPAALAAFPPLLAEIGASNPLRCANFQLAAAIRAFGGLHGLPRLPNVNMRP